MTQIKYLQALAAQYPTRRAAASEIVNLRSICKLPKGTEYFFSDLHGEHEAFSHLLRSASGVIREKVELACGTFLEDEELNALAMLVYYPYREMRAQVPAGVGREKWYQNTINNLVRIAKEISSKYTRSRVRKRLPPEFSYTIDEILNLDFGDENKRRFYDQVLRGVMDTGMAEPFIASLCRLIRVLAVDKLHILGDIFDRGPRADIIMDELIHFHDVDVLWGNHDISWMGAAAGNLALIANVVRMGISYNNFDLLEDGYGINLRALSMFASEVYRNDPCEAFSIHILDESLYDRVDPVLAAKMHKAMAIIQFKLEGQIIERHPEYGVQARALLECIDFERNTIMVDGKSYALRDESFPTVNPEAPNALTRREEELMLSIQSTFLHSRSLHRHIRFLYAKGGMYKRVNGNLLYHGCIPMKEDGRFDSLLMDGVELSGRALLDAIEKKVQNAYFLPDDHPEKQPAMDFMWYLWCGPKSPLFGKHRLTTFERYFIRDSYTHVERLNAYYRHSINEDTCDRIFEEFSLPIEGAHIINGHMPVEIKKGEDPVKAGGKLFVIDGGLSKAYQQKTGIAGYTLIFNSQHLALAEHMPFDREKGTSPRVRVVEEMKKRVMVEDTDGGRMLKEKIADLESLMEAYRDGVIKEGI